MSVAHLMRRRPADARGWTPMKTLLTAIMMACVLTACGTATDAGAPAQSPPAPSASGKVSDKLKFTAKTLDDQEFSGASLAGKAGVFWFWAPWCPRCQGEAPHMGALASQNAGKITFVGVGAQDQLPAMKKFVAENEVSGFTHLADLDATVWTRFGITQQPAYAFVYPDGTIEIVKQQLTEQGLNEKVSKLTTS
jgi:thiol-disulfide isomerase/thioredoxin